MLLVLLQRRKMVRARELKLVCRIHPTKEVRRGHTFSWTHWLDPHEAWDQGDLLWLGEGAAPL